MAKDVRSNVILGIDVNEFRRGITQVDSSLRRIHGQFQNLGGVIGASFAVAKIQAFTSEAIDLGVQLEGVKAAFEKLNTEADLDRLRTAVKGTVSDLEIMKQANQAASVNIGMETLATTMQYVQKYARATGNDMQKLMGDATQELIRQTGLRLDQLGIDLLLVRDRMKVTGNYTEAVLSIMRENMERFGDSTETVGDRVDQQRARIENLKASIGEGLLPAYETFLSTVNTIMDSIAGFTDKVGSGISDIADALAKLPVLALGGADISTGTSGQGAGEKAFLLRQQNIGMAPKEVWYKQKEEIKGVTVTLEYLKEQLQALQNAFNTVEVGTNEFYKLRREIEQAEQKIKDLTQGVVPQTEALKVNAKTTNDVYQAQEKSLRIMRQLPDAGMAYTESLNAISTAQQNFDRQLAAATAIGAEFGYILNTAFTAAVQDGEDFFQKMREGIKAYIQQMIAATAATIALASALAIIFPQVGFKAIFTSVGGGMGLPFGFDDTSGNFGLRIAGNDFYTGMERNTNRNTRTGG